MNLTQMMIRQYLEDHPDWQTMPKWFLDSMCQSLGQSARGTKAEIIWRIEVALELRRAVQ